MIKKFWNSISNVGVQPGANEKQVKRITLINQYTVIAFLIYFINGIVDIYSGYLREGLFLECSAIGFMLALYLNKKHHHRISIVFIFIYTGLTILYFGTIATIQAGDYLYYFPLILAISFVLDFEKDKAIMISLFCFLIGLISIHAYTYSADKDIELVRDAVRYRMFVTNLLISASTVGFFIYLSIKDNKMINRLYEQRLKDRETSEQVIKKALMEKEVLLAELHHRVKNNLAVIVGFFNLKLNTTENEEARNVLMESKNHVNAMALIHNRLYKTGNFSEINFNAYVSDLIGDIQKSYPSLAGSVSVQSHIQDIKLNLNTAVPCALILNELLTNCYKHAFKTIKLGLINIELLINKDNQLTLCVKDNGAGLQEGYDKSETLGMSIINGLSEQLNGKARFYNDNGACFVLVFNKE